jgi:hypothetical protein
MINHLQVPVMRDCPTLRKFPEGSIDRDYDIFEELPNGIRIWRACVIGMENAELKLQELARESNNKFLAVNLGHPVRTCLPEKLVAAIEACAK